MEGKLKRRQARNHHNLLTILLVDGNASERWVLSQVVRAQGWHVVEASSGEAAIDMVKERLVSLVLLEVALPDMNGFEVCRRIRKFSSVPVIMVTAIKTESDRVAGLASGADDYVVKPYSPKELVARMLAVLRRSGAI
jgi:DNA-binding response OmpR family regulator